jgi:large subunit ribosomal protein L3
MAGRMGNSRVTLKGIKVVEVDRDKKIIFLKGAVPGGRNSKLEIYKI